jgi:transposase
MLDIKNIDKNDLPNDYDVLKNVIVEQSRRIESLEVKYQGLINQILNFRRNQFGQKSEPFNPNQQSLFGEEAPIPQEEPEKETISYTRNKKRTGRNIIPPELRREEIKLEIPEDKRICPCGCGKPLKFIGYDESEQLEIVPQDIYVKKYLRAKYASCDSVVLADLPEHPIKKCLAGSGLLTDTIINKYQDHQPLYRQEKKLLRHNVNISRQTLCGWVHQCADLLSILVATMKKDLLLKPKIHTDDTSVLLQQKTKSKKTYFWVYLGEGAGPPVVIYDYSLSRSGEAPTKFLKDYNKGYIQADAYPGYDNIFITKELTEVGCMAHCRRKFFESYANYKCPEAKEALEFIQQLYKIEKEVKDLPYEKIKEIRQQRSIPILTEFKTWLDKTLRTVLPKSPTGGAIGYALKQWTALTNYTKEGYLSIDNNAAERLIKPLVIGRKNWLQLGSEKGGKNAAALFSLIETCKANNVNTFNYLKDVLTRIQSHNSAKLSELLPYNWKPLDNK